MFSCPNGTALPGKMKLSIKQPLVESAVSVNPPIAQEWPVRSMFVYLRPVHLGQDDVSVKDARRIVGPDLLIGVSTHNLDQVRQAILDGASYLGIGPTFPSATKEFTEFPGLEFIHQASAETSLPLFVIGGINAETLPAAVAAGARRVAVSQAVCRAA